MKAIPLIFLVAAAYFCGAIRDKFQPPPPAMPVATPSTTPTPTSSESPAQVYSSGMPSEGVLNERAKVLPQPDYPAAARAVRASGTVNVQVLVDPTGKVVSASAVSGHTLLRVAAEQAARKAEFEPMVSKGQNVSYSGVLIYTFKP